MIWLTGFLERQYEKVIWYCFCKLPSDTSLSLLSYEEPTIRGVIPSVNPPIVSRKRLNVYAIGLKNCKPNI